MLYETLIIIALITLNGAFAMAEMALVTARRSRLQAKASTGSRAARFAVALSEEPSQFLSTVQIGITLIGIVAGVFGGATIAADLEAWIKSSLPALTHYAYPISYTTIVIAITYFSLIIGELVPKQLALAFPETITVTLTPLIRLTLLVFRPFVYILDASTKGVLKLMPFTIPGGQSVTDEDVRSLIRQGAEQGTIETEESTIVSRTLRLGDRPVEAIMTPRIDLIWIDIQESPESIWGTVVSAPHSYFPACDGSVDNFLGMLSVKDLAIWRSSDPRPQLSGLVRETCALSPNTSVLDALGTFRREKRHSAVVVDEHGTIDGLITTHDLLEAMVGELSDNPKDEPIVLVREDKSILVDGWLDIGELADRLGLSHDALAGDGSFRSVGGLIMWKLSGIPKEGDIVTIADYQFEVLDMDRHRVDKVLVRKTPPLQPVE